MNITKNKKWILIIVAFFILGAAIFFMTKKDDASKTSYREIKVEKSLFTETIISTGTVAPENRLAIKPPIGGRVEKILVDEGRKVKAGEILAWVSTTERAALIDSARAEGATELAQWEQFYKPTPVYAPINGMIILRNLEPGQSFNAGDSILVMSDRLTIKAQVDETSISKVSLGQKAVVVLDAYPNEKLDATVVHLGFDSRTINSVTSYIVDVLPGKVPGHMLSGMTANVEFILSEIPNALIVPNEAIQTKDGNPCIKQKKTDNTDVPECNPVKLGASNDLKTVVLSGLQEGETILVPELKPIDAKRKASQANPFSPMGSGRPSGGGGGRH